MSCKCNTDDANLFIQTVFRSCVSNFPDILAFIFGQASLYIWIIALYPQIRLNYLTKKCNLSLAFLYLWIAADVLSLASLVTLNSPITQIIIGTYHVTIDLMLYCQWLYYRIRRNLKPLNQRYDKREIMGYIIILILIVAGTFVFFFLNVNTINNANPSTLSPCTSESNVSEQRKKIGEIIGFSSIPFYAFSRPVQIYKNYVEKKTDGLSILMFLSIIAANTFYLLSALIDGLQQNRLFEQFPFIFNAMFPVFCDLVILYQFVIYKDNMKPKTRDHILLIGVSNT